MELRQFLYAIQIAAEKNFSRAAEKLHLAQPSLSQQLSKLEKEIGVLLFQRNTNSVEITHAGEIFVDKAQKILDMVNQLKKEMEDISLMRKGKLVVGSLPITGSHILPLVLPVFQNRYPEIEIVLVEETSSRLEHLTSNGQTDICLLTLPLHEPSLTFQSLIDEEIWLALPTQHPLIEDSLKFKKKDQATIQIKDLENEPFIVLKKGQGFRQITEELCLAAGFQPKIVFESSNIDTVQSLVAAGMGIAFVPSMIARKQGSPFTPAYVPLHEKPHRTLVIAYRKGRYLSKAAEAFIETLLEVTAL
jgi:LysR family hydrogen peroxide-inducible transcriptional activator